MVLLTRRRLLVTVVLAAGSTGVTSGRQGVGRGNPLRLLTVRRRGLRCPPTASGKYQIGYTVARSA